MWLVSLFLFLDEIHSHCFCRTHLRVSHTPSLHHISTDNNQQKCTITNEHSLSNIIINKNAQLQMSIPCPHRDLLRGRHMRGPWQLPCLDCSRAVLRLAR